MSIRATLFLTNLSNKMANPPNLSHEQLQAVKKHEQFILYTLVDKLGDNLARTRQTSQNALVAMSKNAAFGATTAIDSIIDKNKRSIAGK